MTATANNERQENIAFMRVAFSGNEDAVRFVLDICKIADVWDNLIDKDATMSDADIHAAFWAALISLPTNPFYRANQDQLLPLFVAGITNWKAATAIERSSESTGDALEIAHVIRYGIADVVLMTAVLTSGVEIAEKYAVELRMRSQRSNFAEYMTSIGRGTANEKPKTTK